MLKEVSWKLELNFMSYVGVDCVVETVQNTPQACFCLFLPISLEMNNASIIVKKIVLNNLVHQKENVNKNNLIYGNCFKMELVFKDV